MSAYSGNADAFATIPRALVSCVRLLRIAGGAVPTSRLRIKFSADNKCADTDKTIETESKVRQDAHLLSSHELLCWL